MPLYNPTTQTPLSSFLSHSSLKPVSLPLLLYSSSVRSFGVSLEIDLCSVLHPSHSSASSTPSIHMSLYFILTFFICLQLSNFRFSLSFCFSAFSNYPITTDACGISNHSVLHSRIMGCHSLNASSLKIF